ncbi:MAG: ROK family protein [Nitrososphaeria archaeon]
MQTSIGVDIGATNLRVAVGVKDGRILAKLVTKTTHEGDEYALSRQILAIINELPREFLENAIEVNIGTTGPLNLKLGFISPVNLPFKRCYLVEPISKELGLPVRMFNDCVVAVIGEKFFGQGRKVDNLVYVTFGSGIGGGVFVDGRLILGKDGNAHEVGHFTVDFEGRLVCGCGKRGHWEAYCSGNNIPKYARYLSSEVDREIVRSSVLHDRLETLTTKEVFDAAKKGDNFALTVIEKMGEINSIGISNIINAYDPELIILGGSVAFNNSELILRPIVEGIKEHTVNRIPDIKLTALGDDVGLYGAIAAAFYLHY